MLQDQLTEAAIQDIEELQTKISKFNGGQIPEERFKAYRLTRGVYGQRQQGVHMFRTKLPYGQLSPNKLRVLAAVSEEFTNGNLHLTTRQNIQLHYVYLKDSPAIWERLESAGITAREACGNTVRNITASPFAGIDPDEPFDVTPHVQAVFEYFLRNPICQDMGRKIKMAFSASEKDAAFTYIHDFGFIPVLKDGQKGFKVVIGGGLGAQPFVAELGTEFLPENELIPFIEAGLRVFDRYGERERRNKARLKYLIEPKKGLGLEGFLDLLEKEKKALPNQTVSIASEALEAIPSVEEAAPVTLENEQAFEAWKATNVFAQKQDGFYGVKIRIPLGDIASTVAKELANIAEKYASEDIRATMNQGLLFRYVKEANLKHIYTALVPLGLHLPGFDTTADVTACPGTDTCNLGVTNSTTLASELEQVVRDEYPELVNESDIKIKISGCMNSCGQHMVANIGFHGSSIKVKDKVAPAQQIVIGGGVDPDGKGFIAEKVIKLPTKRIPQALRIILDDYQSNSAEGEYFNDYFRKQGKRYFYDVLKHLGDTSTFELLDFQDWGKEIDFTPEIGVGECAGVMMDLVGTILGDAEEHLRKSEAALAKADWTGAIYYAYNTQVIGAKAILLSKDIKCNTHKGIIDDFKAKVVEGGLIQLSQPFDEQVLQINQHEPSEAFANEYFLQAQDFLRKIVDLRKADQIVLEEDKVVVGNHYKA